MRLADNAQRLDPREVSIVRDECRSVDGQGARGLDSVRDRPGTVFAPETSARPLQGSKRLLTASGIVFLQGNRRRNRSTALGDDDGGAAFFSRLKLSDAPRAGSDAHVTCLPPALRRRQ